MINFLDDLYSSDFQIEYKDKSEFDEFVKSHAGESEVSWF